MFFDPQCKPVILSPVARVLLDAAADVERGGWCQGAYEAGDATCPVEAILRVAPDCFTRTAANDRLGCFIGGGRYTAITIWNDVIGRTKEEVVTAMRGAARLG
jgi:hypothetical protein